MLNSVATWLLAVTLQSLFGMLLKSSPLSSLLLLYSQWAVLEVAVVPVGHVAAVLTAAMDIAGVTTIAEELHDWHPVDIKL